MTVRTPYSGSKLLSIQLHPVAGTSASEQVVKAGRPPNRTHVWLGGDAGAQRVW